MRHRISKVILSFLTILVILSCQNENSDQEDLVAAETNAQLPEKKENSRDLDGITNQSHSSEDDHAIGVVINDEPLEDQDPESMETGDTSGEEKMPGVQSPLLPLKISIVGSQDFGLSYSGDEIFTIKVQNSKGLAQYCIAPYLFDSDAFDTFKCQNADNSLKLEAFKKFESYTPFDADQVIGQGGDWIYDSSNDIWSFQRTSDDVYWLENGGVKIYVYSPKHNKYEILHLQYVYNDNF